MSDTEDQPFIKPPIERKKEKRKKKKQVSDRSDESCASTMEVCTIATKDSITPSPLSTKKMAQRKRPWRPTDEDESSDSCDPETDASVKARTVASKKCRPKSDDEPKAVSMNSKPTPKISSINVHAAQPSTPTKPITTADPTPTEAYSNKATTLVDEVLKYCLDESKKIGKVQTTFIMERVSDLNRIVTRLALRNNFLSGALQALQSSPQLGSQTGRASQPIMATAPPTATAPPSTASLSYASIAGRNLAAQRRSAATLQYAGLPTTSTRATPTPMRFLAPNGVLPTKSRAFTEQVIAAAQSAPARHCVVIRPENPVDCDSAATKKLVFKNVDLRKAQVGINSVRPTKDGGIIIETPNAKDLKLFSENAELRKAGLSVAPPKTDLPRVIVYDIPKDLDAPEIADHIRAQNLASSPTLDKAVLRPLFKVGRKDKEGNDWVVEVSSPIRESLLPRGKIYVSYSHCRVADYLVATRCFKCQKYGHVDKYCKSKDTVCAFCAKTGHSNKECPNREKNPTCSNCKARQLSHNHSAGNRNCPSRSSALLQKASRIKY
ncbi:uncharacterized protein LOC128887432 [Hylaeus anthracinus]|uniref:uncharacterized protein LOC128887432 n=1 Tax=Hylaeus anthracinus TaxID=313031 RepID=UPI0023B9E618|nr:uncharacterized protein LOC128887432 [Hylaeus anthracinus]